MIKEEPETERKPFDVMRLEAILSGVSQAISSLPHKYGGGEEIGSEHLDSSLWDLGPEILDGLGEGSSSAVASSGELLEFSTSIADCLDYFATSKFALDFSGLDFRFLVDYDQSDGPKLDNFLMLEGEEEVGEMTPFKRTEVIEDLAQYLLHETR